MTTRDASFPPTGPGAVPKCRPARTFAGSVSASVTVTGLMSEVSSCGRYIYTAGPNAGLDRHLTGSAWHSHKMVAVLGRGAELRISGKSASLVEVKSQGMMQALRLIWTTKASDK